LLLDFLVLLYQDKRTKAPRQRKLLRKLQFPAFTPALKGAREVFKAAARFTTIFLYLFIVMTKKN
ncbi:MAG TPA: hypothetical protein VFW78_05805, partial [Bacteroidia bacterium]|nr:hypothetical protein [Bacteroidia bacterium]